MAAASAPPTETETTARGNPKTHCDAKTRRGTKCSQSAGWGTDHTGYGRCKLHGGSSPNGNVAAAREQAIALSLEYEVEPHEALLRAVGQAARWELVCRHRVAGLDPGELAVTHVRHRDWVGNGENGTGGGSETIAESHADLNVWVRAHRQSVRDLASIAKTAIDAGVDERRVRVVEQLGGEISEFLAAIFDRLELTDEQRVKAQPIVREQLMLLEGGAAA